MTTICLIRICDRISRFFAVKSADSIPKSANYMPRIGVWVWALRLSKDIQSTMKKIPLLFYLPPGNAGGTNIQEERRVF